MPYQFVRDEDMPDFVRKAISRLNSGLYDLQKCDGIEAYMPTEMTFSLLFVTKPQEVPIITTNNVTKTGTQGGTSTTVQTGTDTAVTSGATTTDDSTQTTTHGETVNTTDSDQTELQGGDSTTMPDPPYLGLQSQPFPI